MPPRFLRINALTRADRHQTIPALRDALTDSGGWITDFKLFSNTSICLNFLLTLRHVGELRSALRALPLNLNEESRRALESLCRDAAQPDADADEELTGTLQVTFVHNEPDLRIEVPPIPG